VTTRDAVISARSLLFVPGDRPDRFRRAASSGADAVVLDLEDSVAEEFKIEARTNVIRWLREGNDAVIRVNGVGTRHHAEDVAAIADTGAAVMLPKAEVAEDLEALAGALATGSAIIPLIESAAGVVNAVELCRAPGVARAAFGSVDLAAQLGVEHTSRAALRHARSAVVLAAAAAGCASPIDGVTTAAHDLDALHADLGESVELGFRGKLAIHPHQVSPINEAFTPSEAQLAWACEVIQLAANGGVAVHNGHMVDKPVRLRAEALLEQAPRGDSRND
jgi:citrate lyase subunit beta / citryl-CoA lyase